MHNAHGPRFMRKPALHAIHAILVGILHYAFVLSVILRPRTTHSSPMATVCEATVGVIALGSALMAVSGFIVRRHQPAEDASLLTASTWASGVLGVICLLLWA
jgi:hypothetical protein